MKKLVVIVLVFISFSVNAQTTNFNTDSISYYLLEILNAHRVKLGKQPLQFDSMLTAGAINHSNYLTLNKLPISHDETPGLPGFAGEYGGEPLRGGEKFASENVANDLFIGDITDPRINRIFAQSLFDNWKSSHGHYHNMINSAWSICGFGISMYEDIFSTNTIAIVGTQIFGL